MLTPRWTVQDIESSLPVDMTLAERRRQRCNTSQGAHTARLRLARGILWGIAFACGIWGAIVVVLTACVLS